MRACAGNTVDDESTVADLAPSQVVHRPVAHYHWPLGSRFLIRVSCCRITQPHFSQKPKAVKALAIALRHMLMSCRSQNDIAVSSVVAGREELSQQIG
jgi:hypothetical protein